MQALKEAWREGADRLRMAGVDTPLLDARLLLQHILGFTYEQFLLQHKTVPQPEQARAYEAFLQRRACREPLAYITGHKEFFGLDFIVTPDVLIPRPDSETLVEAVLERASPEETCAVLDLGTGSGCLLLSLLSRLPNASGTGTDISPAALEVARRNAKALKLDEKAEFLEGSWCAPLGPKKYEIVVANPPYIVSDALRALMPEVVKYEPSLALDGGADGLHCYRQIAEALPPHLGSGALVATEAGVGQSDAIASIFSKAGFSVEAVKRDLAGIPRCVVLRWPAA